MPSKIEMKVLSFLAEHVRKKGKVERKRLVLESSFSIDKTSRLLSYLPLLFHDIEFSRKSHTYYTTHTSKPEDS